MFERRLADVWPDARFGGFNEEFDGDHVREIVLLQGRSDVIFLTTPNIVRQS